MSKIIHRITNILTIIAMIACVIFDIVILTAFTKFGHEGGIMTSSLTIIIGFILVGFHIGVFTVILVVKNKLYKKRLAKKQTKELEGAKA